MTVRPVRDADGNVIGWRRGTVVVAGPLDESPERNTYLPGGYDPDCGLCWLGFGHSEEAHRTRTAS